MNLLKDHNLSKSQSLIHQLIWKYKNATGYVRVFSSIADIQAYRHCASGKDMLPQQEAIIRVRELDGHPILCRAYTTDPSVLWNAFYWRYHVPPVSLKSFRTVVDLGANVGYTAAHWCVLCPNATVLAVEMDPSNARMAERNTELWRQRCKIDEAAVWPENGTITYGGDESWGLAVSESGVKKAKAITLEALFAEYGIDNIDLVKMDIEGAEQNIFESDLGWLQKVKRLILEYHDPVDPNWLIELLTAAGFKCSRERIAENIIWAFK